MVFRMLELPRVCGGNGFLAKERSINAPQVVPHSVFAGRQSFAAGFALKRTKINLTYGYDSDNYDLIF